MRHALSKLEDALLLLAAAALVLMLLHVTLEVLLRLAGIVSQLQTITFVSAWYMVAVVFCALPFANREEGHISVDILTSKLPSGFRGAMQRVFNGMIALCLGFIAWLSLREAWEKSLDGEIWETSTGYFLVWPGRWLVALAFVALALHYLLRFLNGADADGTSSTGSV